MRRLALAVVTAFLLTTPAPALTFNVLGLEITLPTYIGNQLKSFEVAPGGGYATICTPLGCDTLFEDHSLRLLAPPVAYEAEERTAVVYAIPYESFAELAAMAAEAKAKGQIVLFDLYLDGVCMRRLEGPQMCALTRANTGA